MHTAAEEWVRGSVVGWGDVKVALDLGSFDINGSVRRILGPEWGVLGIDARPGPGVDRVLEGHRITVQEFGNFPLVTCCEVFEHDPWWSLTLRTLWYLVAPGGLMIVTCAGPGRAPHELDCSPGNTRYYENRTLADVLGGLDEKACRVEGEQRDEDVRMRAWKT